MTTSTSICGNARRRAWQGGERSQRSAAWPSSSAADSARMSRPLGRRPKLCSYVSLPMTFTSYEATTSASCGRARCVEHRWRHVRASQARVRAGRLADGCVAGTGRACSE